MKKYNIDYFIFYVLSFFVMNTLNTISYYEDTKLYYRNKMSGALENKVESIKVQYSYVLRQTQKIGELVEKMETMRNIADLYYYTIYSKYNEKIFVYDESKNTFITINDREHIINSKNILFRLNGRYFIKHVIPLNTLYNRKKSNIEQSIVCLEEIEFTELHNIKENELNFRNRKLRFNLDIDDISINVFINVSKFIKDHKHRYIYTNILLLIACIIFGISMRRLKNKHEKSIKVQINKTVREIDELRTFIEDNRNILHTSNINHKLIYHDTATDVIATSINHLIESVKTSIIKIRNTTIDRSRAEIGHSKKYVKKQIEKAFKKNVPDIDFTYNLCGFTIDAISKTKAASVTEGDGTISRKYGNKIFIMVYDVSGHDPEASYKSVIFNHEVSKRLACVDDIDMETALRLIWCKTEFMGFHMIDGICILIDMENKSIEYTFLGGLFFIYIDETSCMIDIEQKNKLAQYQHIDNPENYIDDMIDSAINKIYFKSKCMLTVATDGFLQARNRYNNDRFGEKRLREMVSKYSSFMDAKRVAKAVVADFEDYTIDNVEDDRTLTIITINKESD